MKKIVFIANLDNGLGMSGGSKIYYELLRNWSKLISITVLCSHGTIKRINSERISNIKFIETDDYDGFNLFSIQGILIHTFRRLIKSLIAVRNNVNLIKQSNYVYSVSDFYPDLVPAFFSKLINKNIKWIAGYYLFAPDPFSEESPYTGVNRVRGILYWLMQLPSYLIVKKFADYVFVTSQPDVQKFITDKRAVDQVIVVKGGVNVTESEKYLKSKGSVPMEKRKYDACFVGRFHYQKGVLVLIDIWSKVRKKRPDAKLAMVGNGPLEKAVRQKIKVYKLEDNVNLFGYKEGSEKYEIFKQSKIIVHPATYDSGGMAAAEGMAWKLPGVSFDLESLRTYYPLGMIKTKCFNEQEFSQNIISLLENKKQYDRMANEAHELIVEMWDWKKRAKHIYQQVFEHEKTK